MRLGSFRPFCVSIVLRTLVSPKHAVALIAVTLCVYLVGVASEVVQGFSKYLTAVQFHIPAIFTTVMTGVFTAAAALTFAATRLVRKDARRAWARAMDERATWWPVRLALYAMAPALAAATIFYDALFQNVFFVNAVFNGVLLTLGGAWLTAVVAFPRAMARPPRALRWPDRVAFGLGIGIVLVELAMLLHFRFFFTTIYNVESTAQRDYLEFQSMLGGKFLGHDFNSRNFYDEEFFVAGKDDFVAVSLTGSFGLGMTPQPYNFTTVMEQTLRQALQEQIPGRVAVHNVSMPSADMFDYFRLYRHEAQPWNPEVVVFTTFMGNDPFVAREEALLHTFLQNWRLTKFLRWALLPYEPTQPRVVVPIPTGLDSLRYLRWGHDGYLGAEDSIPPPPPFVENPDLERPTFTPEAFLQKELERAVFARTDKRSVQELLRLYLQAMGKLAQTVEEDFLVVIAPDEYHVNDALWEDMMAVVPNPEAYDRYYVINRVKAYLETQGIPYLDLTPILQEAQAQGRVFHLRDTHWNARGNAVAGKAIAAKVLELLDERGR